jgi:hypothetical protein
MSKRSKDEQILSAFEGYDEGLRLLLNESERRAEDSRLSPQERKKLAQMRRKEEERKRKAQEKAEAQKANRFHVLLPKDLKRRLEEIAAEHGVSESQVVTFLLFEAVDRYKKGEIGFWGFKYPSKSPRYQFNLVHPKDTERESRKNEKSW